jgi:hypothetical protein
LAWRGASATEARAAADRATPSSRTPAVRLRARTAAVHSDDPSRAGTTADLFAHDPVAAYAAGRELFTREFTPEEGLFGRPVARPLLEDGVTPVVPGGRVASCATCHATPFHDAGSGPTIEKNGPSGRNTPHLFGAGLVEMVGWEIRRQLLVAGDTNRNGFIDLREADGRRAIVRTAPSAEGADSVALDFGSFGDADGDGLPDLNPICRVVFVDASGRRLPGARRLSDPGVAGYDLEVEVFGWGHAPGNRAPLSSTLRGFSAAAFNVHQGLQAHDPTLNAAGDGRLVTGASLCGAPQFATARTPDAGLHVDADGASLDDPDGDGVADELTEGDLDLVEFFLLNHPPPAELAQSPRAEHGRAIFSRVGCARCHVPDWSLPAAEPPDAAPSFVPRATGDRRSFALDVVPDVASGALLGRLRMPPESSGFAARPRGALVVRGVYSDFRRHDLGPAFHQVQFDGSLVRTFRTPPLWGVGSTAPYGHDGASLDLDSVIRRHGGEAASEASAYASASEEDREAVLAFLRGLVLYSLDEVTPPAGDAATASFLTRLRAVTPPSAR